MTDTHGF